jgi:hypothetical protein
MNRIHADRNPPLLDMHKDWGDWDQALVATVPLITSLAELSDRLGDDARVRRLLTDLARLDGPALSTLADRLHERAANPRRAA